MQRNPDYPLASPDPFMGYCVDLLKRLQEMIGFRYRIHAVADDLYGDLDPTTKRWNGMIREIMDNVSGA